jgi:putative transposase
MKYAFIQRHRRVWPIRVQCGVLEVSVSGYHQHLARRRKMAQRRHLSDEALLVHIRAVYAENRGAYGWPRIWRELRNQGVRVGKQRVQRLMQERGIRARGKRRFRVTTTDSRHDLPIAPNLLNRNFTVAAPNQAWAGDLTYIATEEGWLFLAVVIDLFSRQVVGWSMQPDMRRDLVIDALDMAWLRRSPGQHAGLVFHSDRGSQYASMEFRAVLEGRSIKASMSRKGNCWDNACSETLFGSLKVERLHGQRFETIRQAKDETLAWILWYNQTRMHSTLNYISPIQFEQNWTAAMMKLPPKSSGQPKEAAEMPVRGKVEKTMKQFPNLPSDLGNRLHDFHIPAATTTTTEMNNLSKPAS